MWKPINTTTGKEYPVVDDNKKREMESDPHTAGKYRFVQVNAPAKVAPPKGAEPVVKTVEAEPLPDTEPAKSDDGKGSKSKK